MAAEIAVGEIGDDAIANSPSGCLEAWASSLIELERFRRTLRPEAS